LRVTGAAVLAFAEACAPAAGAVADEVGPAGAAGAR